MLTNSQKIEEIQSLLKQNNILPKELAYVTGVRESYIISTLNYYGSMTDDKYKLYKRGIDLIIKPHKSSMTIISQPKNEEAPKLPKKKATKAILPDYVIHCLTEHRNTFVHKSNNIKDVVHTLLKDYGIDCTYEFDKDNGYILRVKL